MWNMDETGFKIGYGKTQWVVTNNASKVLVMPDPDNREYITSAESINGIGHAIPAFLILQGKHTLHKWALHNNLSDETFLATSDSRYSNDGLAMDWLRHFNKHNGKCQVGLYRLLIMDGYGSHLTYEFWSCAKKHNIILFCLSPHSTHLTQPLDIGYFQLFKHYHTQAIDCIVQLGDVWFRKLQFLAEFQTMRERTFTEAIICSVWKKTGLIPFNLEMVLSKIWETENMYTSRSTTPPSTLIPDNILDRTPHNSKEIIDQRKIL